MPLKSVVYRLLIYKENSTNCYFSIYLLGWETLVNKSFSKLEIDFDEALIFLEGVTLEKKFELYQSIKQMNSNEKKLIQQYFLNAFLEGGSSEDQYKALILKEILTECEMFDTAV